MASCSEENLCCSVCLEIFRDPVLLPCSHSFCRTCWELWWRDQGKQECPVCKSKILINDPPRNLALKNLCEDFLQQSERRRSSELCSLHAERLKLFCLDHQQPVCLICLHSTSHHNHNFRPINEAAREHRARLRGLLKPLQEELEFLGFSKLSCERTERDSEVQAQDTERRIKDQFSMLRMCLQKEEQARLGAVREEQQQRSQMMKTKAEALSRDIAALSHTVRATKEVLGAQDLDFLQDYKTATERLEHFQIKDPELIPGGPIDTDKHLNNLPFNVLDSIKKMIPTSKTPDLKTHPEPLQNCPKNLESSSSHRTLSGRVEDSFLGVLGPHPPVRHRIIPEPPQQWTDLQTTTGLTHRDRQPGARDCGKRTESRERTRRRNQLNTEQTQTGVRHTPLKGQTPRRGQTEPVYDMFDDVFGSDL